MSGAASRPLARRSFLSRIGVGAAAFGAAFGASGAVGAQTTAGPAGPYSPARHSEDDWLDQTTARHRLFIDTTTVHGLANAILYTNNFLTASRNAYSLTDGDSAIVLGVRHESTPFAFTDAMWAKYGAELADHAAFTDPKTKQVPVINVFQTAGYNTLLPSRGITLDSILKRGLRLSVCQLATRAMSGAISQKTGAKVDDVFKELTSNLVANAHMVPAGIVAVNRAQERGYTFSYIA